MGAEIVAATLIAVLTRAPWWVLIGVAALVFVAATLCFRDTTLLGWLARAVRRHLRTRSSTTHAAATALPEPFSVELPGVGPVGMVWDGQYAITMVELHGHTYPPSVLAAEGVDSIDTVPLHVIAGLLRQFGGLELHSIDILAVGRRTANNGRYTPCYDEIIGDRPAVGERHTWLVLRICPQACMRALAYRGNVAIAVAAATERIRQAVLRTGCRAVTCSADQITTATKTLLDDHELARVQERRCDLRLNQDYVTTYRIAGCDLTPRLLNDLWTIRASTTVTMLRLTRQTNANITIGALVRVHTRGPLPHPPLSTLHTTPGQSLAALHATLPLGNRSVNLPLSTSALRQHPTLPIPVAATGVLMGMARSGVPFLMPITDPLRFTRIAINANLAVVQALLLRASAAGATVLIHTDRPQLWAPLCDDERLELAQRARPRLEPTVVVADGYAAQQLLVLTGERGHALVTLTPQPSVDCDIVIRQISDDDIVVTTPERDIPLAIMRPRNESQPLVHLRDAAERGPRR